MRTFRVRVRVEQLNQTHLTPTYIAYLHIISYLYFLLTVFAVRVTHAQLGSYFYAQLGKYLYVLVLIEIS